MLNSFIFANGSWIYTLVFYSRNGKKKKDLVSKLTNPCINYMGKYFIYLLLIHLKFLYIETPTLNPTKK